MELLYKRKFFYWKINKAKNYSLLSRKDSYGYQIYFNKKYINLDIFKKAIFSTDSEKLKKYYGDVFSVIDTYLYDIEILKDDNFLIFNRYFYHRRREFFQFNFKKNKYHISLKVNLNNGDFIIYKNYNGSKTFHKNHFKGLFFLFHHNGTFNKPISNSYIMKSYCESLNDMVLEKTFTTYLGFDDKNVINSLIKFFIEKKNIKTPNNYYNLIIDNYPTKKYLKKNDNKLILSILDFYKIKCKYLNKKIHEYSDKKINFNNLYKLCNLFGSDFPHYIKEIPFNVFLNKCDHNQSFTQCEKYELTTKMKKSLVKLMNDFALNYKKNNSINGLIIDIYDHFLMWSSLKNYGININIEFNNRLEFLAEHKYLTELYRKYLKGYYYFHDYSEKSITILEEKIDSFTPFILKHEDDFYSEGKYMHHCVSTYVERKQCLIISLRKDDDKERVTCEFDMGGNLIQARYFCNAKPPIEFESPIQILTKRVKKNIGLIKDKMLNKVKIEKNELVNLIN